MYRYVTSSMVVIGREDGKRDVVIHTQSANNNKICCIFILIKLFQYDTTTTTTYMVYPTCMHNKLYDT